MLPLSVKLRVLQDAQEARAADEAARLGACQGYAVWDEDGRVGTVVRTSIGRSGSSAPPSTLAVRTGLFRRRVVLILEADINFCDPARGMITLKPRAPGRARVVMPVEDVVAAPRGDS